LSTFPAAAAAAGLSRPTCDDDDDDDTVAVTSMYDGRQTSDGLQLSAGLHVVSCGCDDVSQQTADLVAAADGASPAYDTEMPELGR